RFFQFRDKATYESAVAMDRADEHGFLCITANDGLDVADLDARQERGFLVKIIGHGGESGGDDAASVIAGAIDDIEGDGGAEIHDDGGRAKMTGNGDGIGEAIGSDGAGPGIINADAAQGAGRKLETIQPPAASGERADGGGRG